MTEEQKAALRIVLDLANENRLDPDDYDQETAWELHEEARKQERAINLIGRMLE